MKLHHLMENKYIGARLGERRHGCDVMLDTHADEDADMAGKVEQQLVEEVNANEPYCENDLLMSKKLLCDVVSLAMTVDGGGQVMRSTDASGLVTEDSGISEVSLSLTDDLEVDKNLEGISEGSESMNDMTDSEESNCAVGGDATVQSERVVSNRCSDGLRTIGQIRESLEEKVRRLRHERAAVDEKIRLAQEVEDLRVREKSRLKQQLVVHRRDRLKKVIADLKKKLEDQSVRLQVTYSTLISLQRNLFRHRSFSRPKTQYSSDSSLEAPF